MKISVLIGTRNRPALLQRCIKSVVMQTYDSVEIVVLDDASAPPVETEPLQALTAGIPLKCLRADKQLGLNAVRNRLLSEATGDVFFIIDDDAFFDADTALQQIAAAFTGKNPPGIVATKIMDARGGVIQPLTPHSRRHIRQDRSILDEPHRISYFLGGAHAIHRTVIEQCGSFDEVLMYGLDEIELAYRALGASFHIEYLPGIVVHHQPPPAPPDAPAVAPWRLYYLTRNRILFAYKHLPFPYPLTYIPAWLSWYGYRAIKAGLLRTYFKGIRDGLKSIREVRRNPINATTIAYLKANYGRLWR